MKYVTDRTRKLPNHKRTDGYLILWVLLALFTFFVCNFVLYYHPGIALGQTESIKAQWTYGMEPDVESFRLFYGETSGNYAIGYTVPLSTWVAPPAWMTLPIPLQPGTYYFSVKAIDAAGNESGFSNEAVFVVNDTTPPGGCSNLLIQMP